MSEIMEILERMKMSAQMVNRQSLESGKNTKKNLTGLMIDDPNDPTEKITVEGFLYRQGWHRNPSMANKNLSNFDVGCSKYMSVRLSACESFSGGKCKYKQMLMWGAPGRGKTHLARGIMARWAENGGKAVYWPLMQFIAKLRTLMDHPLTTPESEVDWLSKFGGLLIIDEVGRTRGNDWDKNNVLYPLLDGRLDKPTLWISNYTPEELTKIYDAAIVSRLCAGHNMPFSAECVDRRIKE